MLSFLKRAEDSGLEGSHGGLDLTGDQRALSLGRVALLLLASGHLLLHRAFAERNLGELFGSSFCWMTITDVALILLLLPAAFLWWRRRPVIPGLYPALFLFGCGLCHALIGWLLGGNDSASSQSVACVYALLILIAGVFFSDDPWAVARVGWWVAIVATLLAAFDLALHRFGSALALEGNWLAWTHDRYHSAVTYPLAILVLLPFVLRSGALWLRGFAAIGALFVLWRMLSHEWIAALFSIVGALVLMLVLGCFLRLAPARRSSLTGTASRALLLMAVLAGCVYLTRRVTGMPPDLSQGAVACRPGAYMESLDVYHAAKLPDIPGFRDAWPRGPGPDELADEIFKIHAAGESAETGQVRDNLLTILVWRRLLGEWMSSPLLGAGLVSPWFYSELAFSKYRYETTRGGHDPGNALLWLLYRMGLVGIVPALLLVGLISRSVWRSYRVSATDDAFGSLEISSLCVGGYLAFALVGTSLTEPSYAMPFWLSLGILSSQAGRLAEQPDRVDA